MLGKNNIQEFVKIFPKEISDEFQFSIESYIYFLEGLSINPLSFFEKWSEFKRQSISDKYWNPDTKLDWKWSLSYPLFSLLENYLDNFSNPKIIGFSGLPGSGKSSLGFWINSLSRDTSLDIKVISLDDFYLPAKEMDIAMIGNPWNVPRGYPGSHSIELLNQSLETFLKTGVLRCPIFDKSLRDGKGDRSGWCEFNPKVLILEGWFIGCEPISDITKSDNLFDDKLDLSLTENEKMYRRSIQVSMIEYIQIWRKLDKIWHLKSSSFNNTILWKRQQEEEMIKIKGSGLKGNCLRDFIRMIQTAIPQESFSLIRSDSTIEIDQHRRIQKLYTNNYKF